LPDETRRDPVPDPPARTGEGAATLIGATGCAGGVRMPRLTAGAGATRRAGGGADAFELTDGLAGDPIVGRGGGAAAERLRDGFGAGRCFTGVDPDVRLGGARPAATDSGSDDRPMC
jgi:hypothetical protein